MRKKVILERKEKKAMDVINVKRFGLAWGTTCALLYIGCATVMAIAGREGTIFLFNSMMHGVDVSTVIRMDVPILEMIFGIIQVFILGWLVGATIASIYSFGVKKK